jgi:hypothetical protein
MANTKSSVFRDITPCSPLQVNQRCGGTCRLHLQGRIISKQEISKLCLLPTSCLAYLFSGVGLSPLGTAATSGLLYKPHMIDEGDYGAIGGVKIGRGKRSTRGKPAPAPLCPVQIPHDLTRARTRAAAVGSQRLTI